MWPHRFRVKGVAQYILQPTVDSDLVTVGHLSIEEKTKQHNKKDELIAFLKATSFVELMEGCSISLNTRRSILSPHPKKPSE